MLGGGCAPRERGIVRGCVPSIGIFVRTWLILVHTDAFLWFTVIA